jgi:hypothetical protein
VKDACAQLSDLTEQRDRSKTFATLSFVGAGVGAAALVTTFLVWKPSSSEARSGTLVRPRVVAGPRAAFLGVVGSF